MAKKVYKVEGMDCASCAMVIESDLEDAGIKARCNFANETLEVELDSKKNNEEKIKNTVKQSGYKVTPINN